MQATSPDDTIDQEWLVAQKIGFVAFMAHVCSDHPDTSEQYLDFLSRKLAECPVNGDFPPSVLHQLRSLFTSTDDIAARFPVALDQTFGSLDWLQGKQKSHYDSPLHTVQALANAILHSDSSPQQLLRIPRNQFRYAQRKQLYRKAAMCAAFVSRFSELLDRLRAANVDTASRLAAVTAMAKLPQECQLYLPFWGQVRNALYHQLFVWPLLILSGPNKSHCGIALPLAFDVVFEGGTDKLTFVDGKRFQIAPYRQQSERHLRKAMDAAKALWNSEHAGAHRRLREAIKKSDLQVDFRFLSGMVGSNRHIKWESAEACFAQTILRRFTPWYVSPFISSGVSASLGTSVTTSLPQTLQLSWPPQCKVTVLAPASKTYRITWHGDWTSDEAKSARLSMRNSSSDPSFRVTVDRLFDPRHALLMAPDGVHGKVYCGQSIHFFDRLIFPRESFTEIRHIRSSLDVPYTAPIIPASTQSGLADLMQVDGWRRNRFIRCPVYERLANILTLGNHALESQVRNFLSTVASSATPVADASADAMTIVAALNRLRQKHRLSWVCLKVFPDELNDVEPFWRLFFAAIGTRPLMLSRFLRAKSARDAAALLARVLGAQRLPQVYAPAFIPPQLTVLIGGQSVDSTRQSVDMHPLSVSRVFAELRGLRIKRSRATYELLGAASILCVPRDDVAISAVRERKSGLERDVRGLLSALSIFRGAFLPQAASNVLRRASELGQHRVPCSSGNEMASLLDSLTTAGHLCFSNGRYHLSAETKAQLRKDTFSPHVTLRLHQTAARTIAPYLVRSPLSTVGWDQAFRTENILEAKYHLRQCVKIVQGDARKERKATHELMRVDQITGELNWLSIKKLSLYREHAYQLLHSIKALRLRCSNDVEYSTHVYIAFQCWQNAIGERNARRVEKFRKEVSSLFSMAEAHLTNAALVTRLSILAPFHIFFTIGGEETDGRRQWVYSEISKCLDAIENGCELPAQPFGELFEIEGDLLRESAHCEAAKMYERGTECAPYWSQNWFKGLGAEVLSGTQCSVRQKLKQRKPQDAARILKNFLTKLRVVDTTTVEKWVLERLIAGTRIFCEEWRGDKDVGPILKGDFTIPGKLRLSVW